MSVLKLVRTPGGDPRGEVVVTPPGPGRPPPKPPTHRHLGGSGPPTFQGEKNGPGGVTDGAPRGASPGWCAR